MFGENIEKTGFGKVKRIRLRRPKRVKKKVTPAPEEQIIEKVKNTEEPIKEVQEIEQTKTEQTQSGKRWEFFKDRIIFRPNIFREEVH